MGCNSLRGMRYDSPMIITGGGRKVFRTSRIETLESRIAPAFGGTLQLADLNGFAASAAGDVNGDGIADFLGGARFADPNGEKSGAVHVIFGQAEPLPTLGIGNLSAAEGQSGTMPFSFPITLSESSVNSVSVLVSTDDGSATADGDFTALTNELVVFAPGETSKSVTVM